MKKPALRTIALCVGLSFVSTNAFAVETTNSPSALARIPIEFRQGSLMVPARANGTNALTFKLDTGFGVTTVHPSLVETLQLRRSGTMTIIGIAGEESADTYSGASFDFGGAVYSPRRLVVIPSDAQRRRRGRDGILGVGFFRRFVVEISPTDRTLTLYDPEQFNYTGRGEIVPLEFRWDTPIIETTIQSGDGKPVRAKFEVDSGCDGETCIGRDFVVANKLDEARSGRAGARVGIGGDVETREGHLPKLQLGRFTLENLPANFFTEGSPAGKGLAGHIGMGTLRKFKVIFDYSRKRMILEPTN